MSNTIYAPWSPEVVDGLNRYQQSRMFHPYTCGGERGDAAHKTYAAQHGQRDWGILLATPDGWVCPACDYQQTSAFSGSVLPPDWTEGLSTREYMNKIRGGE